MSRVLILTAGYGEGHNSAARALQSAFLEKPGVTAELVDVFALRAPRLNNLSRRVYIETINHAPALWSGFYRWLDRSPRTPALLGALASHARLLAGIIQEKQPDVLVSTYPVYAWMIARLRAQRAVSCPLFTVVTDAITINSLWYRAPSDGWFVTDQDSAAFLRNAGLTFNQVAVSGFPVSLAFADRAPHLQPPTLTGPASAPRILYIINSNRSRALETARALLQHPEWHITFTAGRDTRLKTELEALVRSSTASTEILGWTDRIPELLMTHHVVISKAGGATTQESINALCPMLVNQIVPGQEEGNYELLRRNEAGALAETPTAIVDTLLRAFANDDALLARWRENLKKLARPGAARDIVARVLHPDRESASADRKLIPSGT